MTYNLNRVSGLLMIFFIGGSTACFPASFIFKANYDPISGGVFAILGSVFLAIGAILVLINKGESKNDKNTTNPQIVHSVLLLNIITAVVMTILGETVKFW